MKNCISKRNLARFVATPYSTLIRNSSYQCNHGTATSYRVERSGKKLSLILEFGVYQTQNYNPFECFKLCSFINDASINVILIAVNCSSFHFYLTSMKVTEQITFYLTFYPFLLLILVLGYYSSRLAGPLPSFRGTAVYFAVTD